MGLINYDVPLINKYMNANIKANILSDDEMKKLGFTSNTGKTWYFCKKVANDWGISFNISINKNDKSVEIEILDEAFCQPCDYQSSLRKTRNKLLINIHNNVQEIMKYLMDNNNYLWIYIRRLYLR